MKRTWVIVALIAVALVGGYFAYRAYQAHSAPAPVEEEIEAPREDVIWASGKLVPVRWAAVSPMTAGTVKSVRVAEGDRVEAGGMLVELDNSVLLGQEQAAKAALAETEAARAKLLAGATPAEIAAAAADVAAAEALLAQAQAGLQQVADGVSAAQAQVAVAEAQYRVLASPPSEASRQAAESQVGQARAALSQAQAAYDAVKGDPHIAARPEALALQQSTLALAAAQAAYDLALQGATPQQLAVARAQIAAAQAQVSVAQGQAPAAGAAVTSAQAQVARAKAALDRLQAGATAEDRAIADATVQSAQAAVQVAQAQLAQTQIAAPFGGEIGAVYLRPGELAVAGQPALILGDTSDMQVETTDLRETDVSKLAVGQSVEVTFDALPGETFEGRIARIAPMSSAEKGSTNYTIIVTVAGLDPSLRWGMTAFVNIRGG